MRNPHFYVARSRIGLRNPPIHTKIPNIGVENGADAILTPHFLSQFVHAKQDIFAFPQPESVPAEEYNAMIVTTTEAFKKRISDSLQPDETQIVVGGDHCVTFPSVLAVIDRLKGTQDLGYIQFDSHGDSNQYTSSISKNWHGMYVRPLVDTFDVPEIDKLVPHKIPTQNVLFLGNLFPFLDPEEQAFFTKNAIRTITPEEVREKKTESIQAFKSFIKRFKHIHITFDIDALDKTIAPATGLPAEHGFILEDIREILTLVAHHSSSSFDLVEVNPQKEGAEKTIETAQEILSIILNQ
jgi:arginase